VGSEDQSRLNLKYRLQDEDDFCQICLAFIEVDLHPVISFEIDNAECLKSTVQIAYFSVQDYLESECIRQQRAAILGLQKVNSHIEIAQICFVYLLDPNLPRHIAPPLPKRRKCKFLD
jgi:ankyrin repeat domain-containing protein 50